MAALDDKGRNLTLLKELRPGMKNVSCLFIIIDRGTTNKTKDGSVVRMCRVADRSASICFSLWNDQAAAIEAGDILKLIKGYTSLWKGTMVLYSGKYGKLEKVGDFTMLYSDTPDMSSPDQEFLHQKQQQPRRSPTGGGDSRGLGSGGGGNMEHTNSVPINTRLGMGPARNWNGNNHIVHEPILPPLQNHAITDSYDSNAAGPGGDRTHPPAKLTTTNDYARGPIRNNSIYHPYQRPPANHQGQDPRAPIPPLRPPGHTNWLPSNQTIDPRVISAKRR